MSDPGPVRRAGIDIGTVSTRLLVADVSPSGIDEVVRRTTITHLGEGVAASGRLAPEAVDRTLKVAEAFRDEAQGLGSSHIDVIATSAARDAEDDAEFADRLGALGLGPAIITGPREAFLSFRGATYSLRDEDVLVLDLGGGSTELILGSARDGTDGLETEVETSRSVGMGSRRVSDLFLRSDPPLLSEIEKAIEWIAEKARSFFDGLRHRPRSVVALGGTATSLSAIGQRLVEYDPGRVHGSSLSGADLSTLREDLAGMTLEERRGVIGLDPARAEVIVGGVLVLETLLGLAGLDRLLVSEHDILYGLVLEGP